ncbi:type IV secretion system protein VirD4 [Desulfofundulus australicus DSM 11792]|uniref:Type IV secretion system protein VirD4 n=1 Tax=Desulfofundulus australicus DSM 11792 TaxID=1121425 RepID=A0A1M4XRP8_9FIRM|nr:type IV secretory system conjugative DNA transfer family protein [Desulfofundulus australicus]SHE96125.1 type IV secretion system protein VirD4 [Desulfofundulus australicus DSM 11792]
MLNKLARALRNRKAKAVFFLILLYILDAWLLGSPAVWLYDTHKGLACFKNPLYAAVAVPVSGHYGLWFIFNVVALILVGIIVFRLYIQYPELVEKIVPRKLSFINDPTCGTSRWMKPEEIPRTFDLGHGPGILLGSYGGQPVRYNGKGRLNRNVIIFGAPGCGKTFSEIIPNCLQAAVNEESIVVTDPKGEITRETLTFFQNRGYSVKVFNLVDMAHSDRWNPLDEVVTDIDAQMFTEVVIANTAVPGIKKMGGDPFWDRAEQNLLKALVLYVKHEYPPEKQTVYDLYHLLAGGDLDTLDMIFKGLKPNHPAKAPYNIYSQAGNTVKGGVIQGLGTRLQVFQNELVRKITEKSDIDLEAPGKELCAYYCIMSDTDTTFDFLASLFFSFLFIKLTRLGDRSGGKCPVNINFLLDEFCNIGAIPDFKKRIATMRSRGISCTIITQSLPQLRNRYPQDAWQEIISCCDTRLFLGINDIDTAKYLRDLMGTGTVEQRSIGRNTKDMLNVKVSRSPKERPLMTLDEILRMDEKKAVLIVRGRHPLMIDKLGYPEHPLACELVSREVSEYIPSWHMEPAGKIEIDWGSMEQDAGFEMEVGTEIEAEQAGEYVDEGHNEAAARVESDITAFSETGRSESRQAEAFW